MDLFDEALLCEYSRQTLSLLLHKLSSLFCSYAETKIEVTFDFTKCFLNIFCNFAVQFTKNCVVNDLYIRNKNCFCSGCDGLGVS